MTAGLAHAASLDEVSATSAAQATVAERLASQRLADVDRRAADAFNASAAVFQRAAKDAWERGEAWVGKRGCYAGAMAGGEAALCMVG